MIIKILGEGCPKCNELFDNTHKALAECGMEAEVIKVEDFREIVMMGVMTTPALVIDDVVKSSGKVLKTKQIIKYLK